MNKYKKNILDKIRNKKAKIGVLGLGYVGLPLSLSFVNSNFKVFGFDTDRNKINKIKKKKSFIWSISDLMIKKALSKSFEPTTSFSKVRFLDVIIICVPTPLNSSGKPDLSYLINSIKILIPNLKKGQLISIESTTYPGTTEEELITRLKRKGLKVGEDFFVCYSPEREDPGNKSFSTKSIPKIVGGFSKNCLDVALLLYSYAIKKVIPVSSLKIAEMTKLHENIYRLINISLVNEMKMICDKMKIDIHEVIEAAKTKPFGFTPYYPGPGIGGHCIPIDPNYLTWKAKQFSIETKFINLAQTINKSMPNWILDKLLLELSLRGKILNKLNILFIGISYKKNVDDVRESPSVDLIKLFSANKALFDYHDPYIPKFNFNFLKKKIKTKKSIKLNPENILNYDLIVISTDHDNIDYQMIYNNSKLILDTRGKYPLKDKKVIKA
jgi:UDP-N-acetyl-D-glucosamine dehydrogenase